MLLRSVSLTLLLMAVGGVSVEFARAQNVLVVCPSGCQFSSPAVAAANAKPGDTVLIKAGTYVIPSSSAIIPIRKKSIVIKSEEGPEKTVIKGNNELPVIIITDSEDITIQGLTVTDGNGAPDVKTAFAASGILIQKSKNIRIIGNHVTNNVRQGIYVAESENVEISGNEISENKPQKDGKRGYGILAQMNVSKLTVQSNSVKKNAAAGIYLFDRVVAAIEGNEIEANVALGIIVQKESEAHIKANNIGGTKEDSAGVGRGISIATNSRATIEENIVERNAQVGIYVWDNSWAIIDKGNEVKNTQISSQRNQSAGIAVEKSSRALIKDNIILGNGSFGIQFFDDSGKEAPSASEQKTAVIGNQISDHPNGVGIATDTTSVIPECRDNRFSNNGANLNGNVQCL